MPTGHKDPLSSRSCVAQLLPSSAPAVGALGGSHGAAQPRALHPIPYALSPAFRQPLTFVSSLIPHAFHANKPGRKYPLTWYSEYRVKFRERPFARASGLFLSTERPWLPNAPSSCPAARNAAAWPTATTNSAATTA